MALQQETRATALSSSFHLPRSPSICLLLLLLSSLHLSLFFVPSFVQSLNADDAKICQKEEEGREREREKSIQRGEENWKSRRGANECLRGRQESRT